MSRLIDKVREADSVAVLGHINPDGDCVGSCLAVLNYLLAQFPQKTVDVYLKNPPKKFSYLKNFDKIRSELFADRKYALCICLDSADRERLGKFAACLDSAGDSICIDHHVTNPRYAAENFIGENVSSTCEYLMRFLDIDKIDRGIAACLYTGILHDTNLFKNSCTTPATMEAAGALMAKGIDFTRIIDDSFYRRTYVQNQILGRSLMESVTFLDGRCIFTAVRKKDMTFYGSTSADLEGIVDQLRVTQGVEVAILLNEMANHVYKVSMRSNNIVDVSRIAAAFGGGGHVRAAGCTMSGSVHDVINNLAVRIEEQLAAAEG